MSQILIIGLDLVCTRKKVMQVCISSIALSRNIQNQVLKPFLSRATLHTMVLLWERLGFWNCTHFVSWKWCATKICFNLAQTISKKANEKGSRDKPLIWTLRSKFSYILRIFHLAYEVLQNRTDSGILLSRTITYLDSEILFQSEFGQKIRTCSKYMISERKPFIDR